jgi:hypothetical protein
MILIEIFRKSCPKKRDLQELILNDSETLGEYRQGTLLI